MLSLAAYAGLLMLPFMAIPFFKTGDGVYLYGFNQVKFNIKKNHRFWPLIGARYDHQNAGQFSAKTGEK